MSAKILSWQPVSDAKMAPRHEVDWSRLFAQLVINIDRYRQVRETYSAWSTQRHRGYQDVSLATVVHGLKHEEKVTR